jgi:hypothetical protein
MEHISEIIQQLTLFTEDGDRISIEKRVQQKVQGIELVREQRNSGHQKIGYNARPFILCGLPLKKPKPTEKEYIRTNGHFSLTINACSEFGLPYGQDRLLLIWVASIAVWRNSRVIRFRTGSEILSALGIPPDGRSYRRLIEGFKRLFGATTFFSMRKQVNGNIVEELSRTHFFDKLRLWFTPCTDQPTLPGEEFENIIELSEAFWAELHAHHIPVDLEVVRKLSNAPGALDFYMWIGWRCWCTNYEKRIPIFGEDGLISQLGVGTYARARKFKEQLQIWLTVCKALWPECPARIVGRYLIVDKADAIISTTFKRKAPARVQGFQRSLFDASAV